MFAQLSLSPLLRMPSIPGRGKIGYTEERGRQGRKRKGCLLEGSTAGSLKMQVHTAGRNQHGINIWHAMTDGDLIGPVF